MELGSELRGSQGGSIPCLPRIISGAAHGCCRAVSGPGLLPGSGFGVRCQSLYLVFFSGCGKPATPAGAEFRWLLSVSGPGSYGKQRSQSCSNLLADELKGCFDPSGYLKIIYFFFNLPSPSFTRGPRQELCVGRQRNYSKSRRVDVPGGCFIAGFHSPFYFFFSFPHPTDCSRSSAPHARAVRPRDPPLQGAAALGTRGQLWAHGSMQERGSTTNSCFAHGLCAS